MRTIITTAFLSLIYCKIIKAQTFSTKFFEHSVWATTAKDSSFFKSDTVVIVNTTLKVNSHNTNSINVSSYFGNSDYFALKFDSNKKLSFSKHIIDSWTITRKIGMYTWSYDSIGNLLKLYFNKKLFASYEPIIDSQRAVEIKSDNLNQANLKTFEISLKRRSL